MTKTDLFLTYELMSCIIQTDTWEAVMAEDPGIQEATKDYREEVKRLSASLRGAGHYEDALSSAVWGLVNAHVQAAILYGYHVAQVLQEAARSPQELAAYMRDTAGGGEAV